jgi:hypothetical protein
VRAYEAKVADEKREQDRVEREKREAIEKERREKQALRDKLLKAWQTDKERREAEADSIRTRRVAGYWLGAGGLALGAGAVFFALKGKSNNDDVQTGRFATGTAIQAAIDKGKTYNTIGYALAGASLLGLGVGIPLVLFNDSSKEPKIPPRPKLPEVTLSPMPGGVLLSWRLP